MFGSSLFLAAVCAFALFANVFSFDVELKVVSRSTYPVLSYVNGTSTYQQIFNPTWVEATKGSNGKSGLIGRTQNCPADIGGACVTCGGSAEKASILTYSELKADGSFTTIDESSVVFGPLDDSDSFGTEDPRMQYNPVDQLYYMFYTAYNGQSILLNLATSPNPTDKNAWKRLGPVFPSYQGSKSAALLLRETGPHYLLWGDSSIKITSSTNPASWPSIGEVFIAPRTDHFDSKLVEAGPPPMKLSNSDFLFFYNSAELGWPSTTTSYNVGWLILDGTDPMIIKARSEVPLLTSETSWEKGTAPYTCNVMNVVFLEAAYPLGNDRFRVYFGGSDAVIGTADIQVTITN